ncbi:hypothetical protein [Latilactobacillus sakei]|uniref:hypothetical protein n=1 Tax=Latilactobacillus sakei TaxID=1599 RepID=UPI000DC64451|nr:hypothetical protein [Latilactobacillus sakei]SPS07288.1 hypothetical protein LAS9624_01539 [Latilactobacillus sakei]
MINKEYDYRQYLADKYSKDDLQNGLDKVTQYLNGESRPSFCKENSLPRLSMYLKGALQLAK